jgi:hypothetical protein
VTVWQRPTVLPFERQHNLETYELLILIKRESGDLAKSCQGVATMVSFRDFKDDYEHNWAGLHIRKERADEIRKEADRLLKGKATYQKIEAKTAVPWWFARALPLSRIPL